MSSQFNSEKKWAQNPFEEGEDWSVMSSEDGFHNYIKRLKSYYNQNTGVTQSEDLLRYGQGVIEFVTELFPNLSTLRISPRMGRAAAICYFAANGDKKIAARYYDQALEFEDFPEADLDSIFGTVNEPPDTSITPQSLGLEVL